MPEKEVEKAREAVRQARRVLVLTGAGISAESGVPTFRGGAGDILPQLLLDDRC